MLVFKAVPCVVVSKWGKARPLMGCWYWWSGEASCRRLGHTAQPHGVPQELERHRPQPEASSGEGHLQKRLVMYVKRQLGCMVGNERGKQ